MNALKPRLRAALGVVPTVAGAIAVAALGPVFAISFVALIYTGPLSSFLGSAIVLTLAGTAIMVVVGAMLHRLPALASPQDTTALLLAGGMASLTATDPGAINGPTVAALVAITTAITGAAVYVAGRFGVGYLARYIPYPVLGGFLAATGYLLATGAIGLLLDRSLHLGDLPGLLEPQTLLRWGPWFLLAATICAATRLIRSELALPVCVALLGVGFYLWLFLAGIDMETAAARGWLLGPFPAREGGEAGMAAMLGRVDLATVGTQLPLVFGVVALTVLGALLNMSGLEIALGKRTDMDAELRAVGLSNLAASTTGGLVGWPLFGESLLAARLNLPIAVSSVGVALACLLGAVLGEGFLETLPRGLFATMVAYLGIDLLVQWLWVERRRFPARDFAVVLLILLTAMTVGFLTAIAVGIGAAAMLFVASYARLDPVHMRSSGAARVSVLERSGPDDALLAEAGEGTVIVELTGFMFFGSAHRLSERLRGDIAGGVANELILDFARVTGVDASAIRGIVDVLDACEAHGVRPVLSSVEPGIAALVARQAGKTPDIVPTLDDALCAAEDRILDAASKRPLTPAPTALDTILNRLEPTLSLAPGETLFDEGSTSREMFILCSGIARAEVAGSDAGSGADAIVIRRHVAGSIIGEIACYTGMPRTASIVAETACAFAVIDLDRLDALSIDRAELHALVAARLADRLARTTRLVRQITG